MTKHISRREKQEKAFRDQEQKILSSKKRTKSTEDNLRKPLYDLNKETVPLRNLDLRRKTSEVNKYDFIIKTPINEDHREHS